MQQVKFEALRLHKTLNANIFPLAPRSKAPAMRWREFTRRRLASDEIEVLFDEADPDSNIAIVCGKVSNLIVLDCDAPDVLKRLGYGVNITTIAETARGRHYYFRIPPNKRIPTVSLSNGLDLRGEKSYVVAPPSLHPTGKRYEWLISPLEAEPAPPPAWLLQQLTRRRAQTPIGTLELNEIVHGVREGRRNVSLVKLLGCLLSHLPPSHWESIAWPLLCGWNQLNKPPLDERDLRYTFDCLARKELQKRRAREKREEQLAKIARVAVQSSNLSTRELAKLTGISRSSISRLLTSTPTSTALKFLKPSSGTLLKKNHDLKRLSECNCPKNSNSWR